MQHHEAVLANENTLARLRTDLWSSPGNITSQSSLQRNQHSGTKSYDTACHSTDPWRHQNDCVNVSQSMQGPRTDPQHSGQSMASSYWQDNLRSQDTFTLELTNDDLSTENNSRDVSRGKREAEHQFRAKRSSSQILALIGSTTPIVHGSGKTPGGRNDGALVEACESVDVTNETVCEVRLREYSEEGRVCGTPENVDGTRANIDAEEAVGGEDVERSDETGDGACLPPSRAQCVQQHTSVDGEDVERSDETGDGACLPPSRAQCVQQHTSVDGEDVERSDETGDGACLPPSRAQCVQQHTSVDGEDVERSDETGDGACLSPSRAQCGQQHTSDSYEPHSLQGSGEQDQLTTEDGKSNNIVAGISVDMPGSVSQESGSDVILDRPMGETDTDSERMCFDICFSPLSQCPSADTPVDQPSYDAAMDRPLDDEFSQDTDPHTVNQCSDIGDEVSVGLDVSSSERSQPGQSDRIELMSPTGSIDVVNSAATTVVCDTAAKGLIKPATDCHAVSSSGDCHIVNYHQDNDILRCDIRGGDLTCSDASDRCDTVGHENINLMSPCGNVVSHKNCTTAADPRVTCHGDDICRTGEANVAPCDAVDTVISPMDDTDTYDCHADDNVKNVVNTLVYDGNIVSPPLPYMDTPNCHMPGDVINTSKVQSSVRNVVETSTCDTVGDIECSLVDNLDGNVDLDTSYACSTVDSVDYPPDVTRRESCDIQTSDIGDLSCHVDNGVRVDESCQLDVDCMTDSPAKSSSNTECYTDDNQIVDLVDCDDDSHIKILATCRSKINQESCRYEGDDSNDSCRVDTDFNADDKADIIWPGEEAASDKTVPEETYSDKVDGSSYEVSAFSEDLEEGHVTMHEEQPDVSDHAMLEGFKSVSDVAASKCAEEDLVVSNDMDVDTDSVGTSDTMCSSIDSLPSNSQQGLHQQIVQPDQHQQQQMVQTDWSQPQRPICLPMSMSRTSTEILTVGIPHITPRRKTMETTMAGIPRINPCRTTEPTTCGIPRIASRTTDICKRQIGNNFYIFLIPVLLSYWWLGRYMLLHSVI